MLVPILLIIKALSRNSKYFLHWSFEFKKNLFICNFFIANTAAVLARDGIVGTMEKVLGNIGFTPSAKLRLALNVITYLSKNSKYS